MLHLHVDSICVSILRNTASGAAEHQAAVRGGNEASQQPPPFSMPACTSCFRAFHHGMMLVGCCSSCLLASITNVHIVCATGDKWHVAHRGQSSLITGNVCLFPPLFLCAFVHVSLPFALLLFLHSPLEPVDIVIGAVRISSKTLGLLLGRRSALRT